MTLLGELHHITIPLSANFNGRAKYDLLGEKVGLSVVVKIPCL